MDPENRKRLPLHLFLFVITFIFTTFAGAEWRFLYRLYDFTKEGEIFWTGMSWEEFSTGLAFSIPFLSFLTVHEFGHFFTARYHKIRLSLPYYIPFWLGGFIPAIGTMGAVIRIREFIKSRKVHFDIGIAGPLAGFVVSLGVLYWGFTHLPPQEYVLQVHPEYAELGPDWQEESVRLAEEQGGASIRLGKNLLYMFFEQYVATQPERVPNPYEIIHYPFLFAGFLGLFFTALNLLPIGQLDGGHILYGLMGHRWHRRIATALFVLLVFWGGLGIPTPFPDEDGGIMLRLGFYSLFLFYIFGKLDMPVQQRLILTLSLLLSQMLVSYLVPQFEGYPFWLIYGFLIGRFLGVYHPRTPYDEPLSTGRQVLGWLTLVIFILCFSPSPFGG